MSYDNQYLQPPTDPAPAGVPTTFNLASVLLMLLALVVGSAGTFAVMKFGANSPAKPSPSASATTEPGGTTPTTQSPEPSVPPTATPVDPPDGDSQRAWITVPSANPKPGALIVDVHFDYQCPYCKILETNFAQPFEDLNNRGDITLRQHTRIFLDGVGGETLQSSSRAAIAAACVDVADATKYAAYHNTIFANQPKEGAGYTDQQLRTDFAAQAGLSGTALTSFQACYDGRATATWVRDVENSNRGTGLNQSGPPKYLYGGNDPIFYDPTTGRQTTDGTGTQAGVMATPQLFVNGKAVNWSALFDQQWKPLSPPSADTLLAFLQQGAAG